MIRKMLRNFWFCLIMAVFSLLALYSVILEGGEFAILWVAIDIFCVVYWVLAARRTFNPLNSKDVKLTPEQMTKIRAVTKRFQDELDVIIKEAAADESNRRKDKKANKKESSDD